VYTRIILLLFVTVYPSWVVRAQVTEQAARTYEGVGLMPRLGEQVPLDISFRNESGQKVALGDFFGHDRPVILTFVYHTCPMLCSALLEGVTATLRELDWTPGDTYDMLTVSFSPDDTPVMAARQKTRYVQQLSKPAAEWHFLTGDESSITALTEAVGFQYQWVEEQQEYVHPAAMIFLGADGTITRYLPDLIPDLRDVRASLVEASEGTIGSLLDRAFLYCFMFDPMRNSYVLRATVAMRIGGMIAALMLVVSLFILWRQDIRHKQVTAPV